VTPKGRPLWRRDSTQPPQGGYSPVPAADHPVGDQLPGKWRTFPEFEPRVVCRIKVRDERSEEGFPPFSGTISASAEYAEPTANNDQSNHQELTGKSNPNQTTNHKNGKAMKHIFTGFGLIGAFALLVLALGCSSMQTQNKENLLIAAGFKVIVPSTATQQQKLRALPAGKVTFVQKDRKIYYVFPDAANNQAYVGGPQQYQAYKQLRLANKLANENLEAAEMNQDASMNWDTWRGWAGPGWVGWR
jgi:hypothetical protein